ncbi:MAG: DUF1559 domain-containing protein, partial [Candidatus Nealsonbacteria bacterium]|nr:DUF1559 domain-containing protein [Candidatus Nealsonbacteria bacterium]
MSIQFTCPHCGVETSVAEQYAGQSGPCASCGKTVTVAPLAGSPGYTASSSPGGSAGALVAVIVIVVIGVLALVVCGGGLFWVGVRNGPGGMVAPMPVGTPTTAGFGCTENLQQIGLAMRQYHDEYDCFPPSSLSNPRDSDPGNPQEEVEFSWRVLLLPYLGEENLHSVYSFGQPWDSEENQYLADSRPGVFRCPQHAELSSAETSYVMVVRSDPDADEATPLSLSELDGDLSQIPLVVEVGSSGISWMEPRDMTVEEIADQVRQNTGGGGGDPYCGHQG